MKEKTTNSSCLILPNIIMPHLFPNLCVYYLCIFLCIVFLIVSDRQSGNPRDKEIRLPLPMDIASTSHRNSALRIITRLSVPNTLLKPYTFLFSTNFLLPRVEFDAVLFDMRVLGAKMSRRCPIIAVYSPSLKTGKRS